MSAHPGGRLTVAVVTVALFFSACSGGGSAGGAEKAISSAGATSVPPRPTDAPAVGDAQPQLAAKQSASTAPKRGSGTPSAPAPTAAPSRYEGPDTLAVTATMGKTCVRPGEPTTVVIQTEPAALLTMVVGYSDNDYHGAMGTGDADATGKYIWALTVSPQAPPGEANVLVGALTNDGTRSGDARTTFKVAGLTGCR